MYFSKAVSSDIFEKPRPYYGNIHPLPRPGQHADVPVHRNWPIPLLSLFLMEHRYRSDESLFRGFDYDGPPDIFAIPGGGAHSLYQDYILTYVIHSHPFPR